MLESTLACSISHPNTPGIGRRLTNQDMVDRSVAERSVRTLALLHLLPEPPVPLLLTPRVLWCGSHSSVEEAATEDDSGSMNDEKSKAAGLLCTLTNHQASVNCVRWSPSEVDASRWHLASASDDCTVMVWVRTKGGPSTSLGSKDVNAEQWTRYRGLTGHTMDVCSPYFPASHPLALLTRMTVKVTLATTLGML